VLALKLIITDGMVSSHDLIVPGSNFWMSREKIQDHFYTITKQYKNKSQASLLHFVLNSKNFTFLKNRNSRLKIEQL
jgi:hypothetical protein